MINKYSQFPHRNPEDFRTETTNRYITEGLFVETATQGNYPEFLTWSLSEQDKERDGKTLHSAYQVVVWAHDEYDAAMKVCGSLQLWERLKGNKRIWNGIQGICPGLGTALEVQKMRIASESMKLLQSAAFDGNVTAQKAVYDLTKTKNQKKKSSTKQGEGTEHDKVVQLANRLK